jgi:hypothetical protein
MSRIKLIVKIIPILPWWFLGKLTGIAHEDRDYDWSLRGMLSGPPRRGTVVLGWLFWLVVMALIAILALRLAK